MFLPRTNHKSEERQWCQPAQRGAKNQLYYVVLHVYWITVNDKVCATLQWQSVSSDSGWLAVIRSQRLKWCEGVLRGTWSSCQTICLSERPAWSCRTTTGLTADCKSAEIRRCRGRGRMEFPAGSSPVRESGALLKPSCLLHSQPESHSGFNGWLLRTFSSLGPSLWRHRCRVCVLPSPTRNSSLSPFSKRV